jgi:hypothetical protein
MGASPTPTDPNILENLRRSAASDNAESRRAAADLLRELLERDFDNVFEATHSWVLDPDRRLREVACRALRPEKALHDDVRVRRLVGRAEMFLGDQDRTVASVTSREVLPYLLGLEPGMLRDWIEEWTANSDERIRADLAAALGAIAPRFPSRAIDGLARLASDPRPAVRGAVSEALRSMVAQQPGMESSLRTRFPGRL